MRLVGPHPVHLDAAAGDEFRSPTETPGLMSPHRLRARTGIAYSSENGIFEHSISDTLGLAARYVVAEVLGGTGRPMPSELRVFGVEVTNTTMADALDRIMELAEGPRASMVAFVNSDCLNQSVTNARYAELLRSTARLVLPDGIGLKIAANLNGLDVRENVNGTDLFPLLCERAAETGTPIYLLGARPGVAAAVAERMTAQFPDLPIAGTRDGYFSAEEEDQVLADIRRSGARILLVAMGVPRQELWIEEHLDRLGVGVAMGVGGLFDFYSGRIPRAPHWVREIGFEWAWRLLQEPGRMWRRYVVGNPQFLLRAWRESRTTPAREARRAPGRSVLLGYGAPDSAPDEFPAPGGV